MTFVPFICLLASSIVMRTMTLAMQNGPAYELMSLGLQQSYSD